MMYNLVLVIFLSNGVEHRVPLIDRVSDDMCVELRDQVRADINSLNELEVQQEYQGSVIEFVDAECLARQIVY